MSKILVYKPCLSNYCWFWVHGKFLCFCPLLAGWEHVTDSDQWIVRSACCHLSSGAYNYQGEALQSFFSFWNGSINREPRSWDSEKKCIPLPCDERVAWAERNLLLRPLRFEIVVTGASLSLASSKYGQWTLGGPQGLLRRCVCQSVLIMTQRHYLPFCCVDICTHSAKAIGNKTAGATVWIKVVAPGCVLHNLVFSQNKLADKIPKQPKN